MTYCASTSNGMLNSGFAETATADSCACQASDQRAHIGHGWCLWFTPRERVSAVRVAPNQVWISGITYLWTDDGWLY